MKLLVVMNQCPFPPRTGSTIVAYNSLKHLMKRHSIDLICHRPEEPAAIPPDFAGRIDFVSQVRMPMWFLFLRSALFMLTGIPPTVSTFQSANMNRHVAEGIQRTDYDAILLFELCAIQYLPVSCHGKMIVNIEDPLSIKFMRMAKLPVWSFWQRMKLSAEARVAKIYEKRRLSGPAKVLLLSESDTLDMMREGGHRNLACVSYGVDPCNPDDTAAWEDREKVIVFSGNMFHAPNVDGALFFLRDIFPLVLEQEPDAKLWIVGSNPDFRIHEAAKPFGPQVVITGRVTDVSGYIKRAAVSVCPVRLKIGVQTKVLEALSCGTPVVTTSAGNSGVGGVSGRHLWVEDDPRGFADRTIELLRGAGWPKLALEGKKLVADRFSWEESASQLERHMESVAAKSADRNSAAKGFAGEMRAGNR